MSEPVISGSHPLVPILTPGDRRDTGGHSDGHEQIPADRIRQSFAPTSSRPAGKASLPKAGTSVAELEAVRWRRTSDITFESWKNVQNCMWMTARKCGHKFQKHYDYDRSIYIYIYLLGVIMCLHTVCLWHSATHSLIDPYIYIYLREEGVNER